MNSCEGSRGSEHNLFSSTASILVRRGLPAVLAMQYEITDRAAIEFSRAFYEAIAEAMPVDAAVSEARKAVSFAVTNTVEWGTPVLHMRAPDGQIFNLQDLQKERTAPVSSSQTQVLINPAPPKIDVAEQQLASLYAEALKHTEAKRWAQALACLQKVRATKAQYKDVEQLMAGLEQTIAAENLRAKVAKLLQNAEAATGREDWSTAIQKIQDILTIEPNHAAAKNILRLAQQEQELAKLYADAQKFLQAKRWQQAIDSLLRIQVLRSHYKDVEELVAKARQEWQRAQELAQPQPAKPVIVDKPAPRPASKPIAPSVDSSPSKRGLFVGLGVIAMLIVIVVILSQNRDQQFESSPTEVDPSAQKVPEDPNAPAGMVRIPAGTFMLGSNDG
ncbi:MAG: CHAT domain-containing protein, partial [bacterium]